MKPRGKPPKGTRPGRRPEPREGSPRMRPEGYFDTFFRDAARRMNFIMLLSARHFEARKFLLDLRRIVGESSRDPPRRA